MTKRRVTKGNVARKDKPTSVRLDSSALARLDEVRKKESRSTNFLIRYAIVKFLADYPKEGLREDVLAKLA